jgi:rhodanese-related sulfurtransferase
MSIKKTSQRKAKKQTKQNQNLTWAVLGIILVLVVGSFLLQQGDSATAASLPREISVTEASSMRDAGAFVLDVRQPEEWVEGHIPGATLIPLGELASRVSEVPQGQEIVVVCRSGNRSQQGRDVLLSAGFEQVTSMAGGVNQWGAAGYDIVTGP